MSSKMDKISNLFESAVVSVTIGYKHQYVNKDDLSLEHLSSEICLIKIIYAR